MGKRSDEDGEKSHKKSKKKQKIEAAEDIAIEENSPQQTISNKEIENHDKLKKEKKKKEKEQIIQNTTENRETEALQTPFSDLCLNARGKKLDVKIIDALKDMGLYESFAIQSSVIPTILCESDRDICVRAPTGSGKTLCYLIPIVQTLLARLLPRLRALIILPTRDLALQVKDVFDKLAKYTTLKSEILIGTTAFHAEQERILEKVDGEWSWKVDVIISTAGRITDHVGKTPGFTLEDLRFLVIDETDEVMKTGYESWLPIIFQACAKNVPSKIPIPPAQFVTWEKSLLRPKSMQFQKLMFSATLGNDPLRIATLQLHNPHMLEFGRDSSKTSHLFSLPETLQEVIQWCDAGEKPLALIKILQANPESQVLCFASSVESTHRLYRLLEAYGGFDVVEFSASIPQETRNKIVRSFKNRKLRIIISSDVMARGMDFESADIVINYDVPMATRIYVHRAGRTARAGRNGCCYTIAKKEEKHLIERILGQTEKRNISYQEIDSSTFEDLVSTYQICLGYLKAIVKAEALGILSRTAKLNASDHQTLSERMQRMESSSLSQSHGHKAVVSSSSKENQAVLDLLRSQILRNMLQ